ncbi:hypothetical protein P4T89_05135 [Bacillus nakamurai]|nr:hypothetical protein [Bacillus nakamurai]MCC9022584.1 hypothetical protein [Bacillus nakamurai]MED1227004.1 hypothetical protein [Bacillus nakamurai]
MYDVIGVGIGPFKLSVYRNQRMINTIMGKEHFSVKKKTAFQQFLPAQKN